MVTDHKRGVDDDRGTDRHSRDDEINGLIEIRRDREHGKIVAKRNNESVRVKSNDKRGSVFLIACKCYSGINGKRTHSEGQKAVKKIDRR